MTSGAGIKRKPGSGWAWRASWRFFRQHPAQTGLTLLGLALGVAIATSVLLTTASARQAFKLSTEALYGRATHQLLGGSQGVPAAHYRALRRQLGLRAVAPVLESQASLGGELFTLLGVAPLAEAALRPQQAASLSSGAALGRFVASADTIALDQGTAARLGLRVGDAVEIEVQGQRRRVELALTFSPSAGSSGLMLSYLENARHWLARGEQLDRIDLRLNADELERVRAWLPPGLRLSPSSARSQQMREMTAAFNTNLTAMSLLALLMGAFLIHNTMSFLVVSRRRHYALLRSLGVTRRELAASVLREATVLALLGSALGALLGAALAELLVAMVTRTIEDLYFVLTVRDLQFSLWHWLAGLGLGTLAGVLPALAAALDAARTPPGQLLRQSALEQHSAARRRGASGAALALALLGAALLALPGQSLAPGFAALFALVLAYALLVPALAARLLVALHRPSPARQGATARRWHWAHAVGSLQRNMSRCGVALAALCVAISATVGVDIMVGSFRASVDNWLRDTLRSDLYLAAPSSISARADGDMDPALRHWLLQRSGVANVSSSRAIKVQSRRGEVALMALDPGSAPLRAYSPIPHPHDDPAALQRGEAVQVSEPLARKQGLAVGDTIELFTDTDGWQRFRIAQVFRDYGSSQGTVVMHRALYNRHWRDTGFSSLGVVLAAGEDPRQHLDAIRAHLDDASQRYLLRDNRSIRAESLAVFDRTFAITHVLRLLTAGVAFLGLFSALMSVLLERAREFALLRSLGVQRRELTAIILLQALLIGALAALLALPLGHLLATLLIDIINVRSFGWSIDLHWRAAPLLQALVLGLGAALLAGLWPAWQLRRQALAPALRCE